MENKSYVEVTETLLDGTTRKRMVPLEPKVPEFEGKRIRFNPNNTCNKCGISLPPRYPNICSRCSTEKSLKVKKNNKTSHKR